MAVYGIILEWDEHTTVNGERIPKGTFFFVSPDAESYLEVERLPVINSDEEHDHYHDELTQQIAGEEEDHDGKKVTTLRMRFVRRFFSQQEQDPNQRVTFDSRLWPPIRKVEDMPGLPADVSYPGLGKKSGQADLGDLTATKNT